MKNLTTPHRCPANQIRYTTTDRRPIVITTPEQLDAKIVSNEYTEQGGIITFNRSLHRIGDNAFMGCSNLVTITLPDGIRHFGKNPFKECVALKYINSSFASTDGLCLVFDNAIKSFAIGSGERHYIVPEGIVSIDEEAFSYCVSLRDIIIGNDVESVESGAFYYCIALENVILGDRVNMVGNNAFMGCSNLTNIILGSRISTIGESSFYYCSNLANVAFGRGGQSIGNSAFRGCSALKTVILPKGIKSIGSYVFMRCPSLSAIVCGNRESLQSLAFELPSGCKVYSEE